MLKDCQKTNSFILCKNTVNPLWKTVRTDDSELTGRKFGKKGRSGRFANEMSKLAAPFLSLFPWYLIIRQKKKSYAITNKRKVCILCRLIESEIIFQYNFLIWNLQQTILYSILYYYKWLKISKINIVKSIVEGLLSFVW